MRLSQAPSSAENDAPAHRWMLLVATSAPSFMLQLDANIVSISLPTIAQALDATLFGIEWVVSAYLLSFAALLMPAGAIADRYGRKRLLLIGIALFTGASLACGTATNLAALVAARTCQGAGAAVQLSAGLAILSHSFHGRARSQAFAVWGAVVGSGMALGPVVGGFITSGLGWHWAFLVNLPIGVVLLVLVAVYVAPSRDPTATDLDIPGAVSLSAALFFLTLSLIHGGEWGWGSFPIVAGLAAAILLFVVFLMIEWQRERPMLDLSYFREPAFIAANLAQGAFAFGVLTMLTLLPILMQAGLGESPAGSGVKLLPVVVPMILIPILLTAPPFTGLSSRTLLSASLLCVSTALLYLSGVVVTRCYACMVPGLTLLGIGGGLLNGETTKAGMTAIPARRSGMASGISGTVRFSSLVIGVALLGALLYKNTLVTVTALGPQQVGVQTVQWVREITAGRLPPLQGVDASALQELAGRSLAAAYQFIFLCAAIVLLLAACLTWWLLSVASRSPKAR